jgi:carbonic anhydrase/acetyltransferase-like protein (isoleucine patch superfamily)
MGLLRRGYPVVPGITSGSGINNTQLSTGDHKQAQNIAFLAPCATLIGNVQLGPHTSIFYKAILKADVAAYGVNTIHSAEEEEQWKSLPVGGHARKQDAGMFDAGSGIGHATIGGANGGGIYIGEGTNIQDSCMVTSYEGHTTIGKYVTVGHSAHIHSATVGDESLIGMGAVLKPGCVVESHSFIAAGAVVERGCTVKGGEIWGGNPAKKLRDLTAEEIVKMKLQAEKYIKVGNMHTHCMKLGGNIPDSFMEKDGLIEMGNEPANRSNREEINTSDRDEPLQDTFHNQENNSQLSLNESKESLKVKIKI